MGVAGWRFALMKRNLSGRAAVVAVLEELPVICSLAVAAGSMIMIGIMLYKDWPQWKAKIWALRADLSTDATVGAADVLVNRAIPRAEGRAWKMHFGFEGPVLRASQSWTVASHAAVIFLERGFGPQASPDSPQSERLPQVTAIGCSTSRKSLKKYCFLPAPSREAVVP
jgi:hypothetical protein